MNPGSKVKTTLGPAPHHKKQVSLAPELPDEFAKPINISSLYSTSSYSDRSRIMINLVDLFKDDLPVLLDTGATHHNFIDERIVNSLKLVKYLLKKPIAVTSIHATTSITSYVTLTPWIFDRQQRETQFRLPATHFLVLHRTPQPVIIGLQTMSKHKLTQIFDDFFTSAADPLSGSEVLAITQTALVNPGDRPDGTNLFSLERGKDASRRPPQSKTTVPSNVIIRDGQTYQVRSKEHFFGPTPKPNPTDEMEQDPRDPIWEAAFIEDVQRSHSTKTAPDFRSAVTPDQFHVVGTQAEKDKMLRLLMEFRDVFANELPSEPCDVPPIEIRVDTKAWALDTRNKQYSRPQSEDKNKAIEEFVLNGVKNKLLIKAPSGVPGWSQVVMVPKKDKGAWRTCIDYGVLNEHTEPSIHPIPLISELLKRVAAKNPKRFATLDLTSGFHQMRLIETAVLLTAFICWMGIYCFLRAPMGPQYIPGLFQMTMENVFEVILRSIMEIYIDDLLTWGLDSCNGVPVDPIDNLIANLRQIL